MIENADLEPRVPYRGELTFDEFAARIRTAMLREHRELRHPEGDVAPRVYFQMHSPALGLGDRMFEKQIEPEWFNSRASKDVLTEQIVKMIATVRTLLRSHVLYVGLVYGMYRSMVNLDDLTPEERGYIERNEIPPGRPQPSEDPQREEILSVVTLDPEIAKGWHAVIHRHAKKPPRLGGWEDLGIGGWDLPAGLMVDPIREAMR